MFAMYCVETRKIVAVGETKESVIVAKKEFSKGFLSIERCTDEVFNYVRNFGGDCCKWKFNENFFITF